MRRRESSNPLAVVLSCIDSRVPAELVLDLGIGDIFSVRVAGNVIGNKSLGSIEYGVAVAGVKLVLVLGHTHCGAIMSTVQLLGRNNQIEQIAACPHLDSITSEVEHCVDQEVCQHFHEMSPEEQDAFTDDISRKNVLRSVQEITKRSEVIQKLIEAGQVMVVGALYDVKSGKMEFFTEQSAEQAVEETSQA